MVVTAQGLRCDAARPDRATSSRYPPMKPSLLVAPRTLPAHRRVLTVRLPRGARAATSPPLPAHVAGRGRPSPAAAAPSPPARRRGEPRAPSRARAARRAAESVAARSRGWARGLTSPSVAPTRSPHVAGFVPNDPGRTGAPGGWAGLQWDLTGRSASTRPRPGRRPQRAGAQRRQGRHASPCSTPASPTPTAARSAARPTSRTRASSRGYDFVDDDPYPDDEYGHGTFVASTIAEATEQRRTALTGVAYGARDHARARARLRRATATPSTIAAGVRYAVRHGARRHQPLARVRRARARRRERCPELLRRAARRAPRAASLVVAAAGNSCDADVAYPARDDTLASTSARRPSTAASADYSNHGPALDLVAPGGGADADAPGDPNCQPAEPAGPRHLQVSFTRASPRRFGILPGASAGTSMAAPHVSAHRRARHRLAACSAPTRRPARSSATSSARRATSARPGRDRYYGAGLVDARRARRRRCRARHSSSG